MPDEKKDMICHNCEEKEATVHYGELYHLCDDCNEQYLEEIAKEYLAFRGDQNLGAASMQSGLTLYGAEKPAT